ncbi:MAG TPA: PAS domain-containing protein [Candidatus Dormibacteraeota bacterium]
MEGEGPGSGQLEGVLAAAGVALARIDLDGRIVEANTAFGRLLEIEPEAAAGRELFEFIDPEDEDALRHGRLTSLRGGTVRADLRCTREGRPGLWTRVSISLVRGADGAPDCLIASFEDISDLKYEEDKLARELLYDPETDMAGHRLFEDRLAVAVRAAERTEAAVLIGVVRIHADADVVVAAERLAGAVRVSDSVARLGRLEFGVLMPGATASVFERALPPEVAAAGVAFFPDDGVESRTLLAVAHAAVTRQELERAAAAEIAEDPDAAVRLRALEPVAIFLPIPDQVLRRIARYTSRHTTAAGEELVLEPGEASLRIIEDGLFEVIPEGQETGVMTLAASDYIGTARHHEDGPLTVRLRALTDSRVLVLEDEALEHVAPPGSPLRTSIKEAVRNRHDQLQRLAERTPTDSAAATNVAIYSTKGGAGRTTIAVNLASELAAQRPGEVLLIDLALPYNHAALLANVVPTTCLARLQGLDSWAVPGALRSAMVGHPDGFLILPGALRPEESELITADLVATAIQTLAPQFTHLVFDLGIGLTDATIAVLERAHRLLVVTTPELATMHDTRTFMELVTGVLQLPSSAIDVVLNHRSPHSVMEAKAVEKVLERPLLAEFRYLGARPESAGLAGSLIVRQTPPSPFAKGIQQIAERVERSRVLAHA